MSKGNIVDNSFVFDEPKEPEQPLTKLAQGSFVYQVQNVDLACCLLSVGIPLREDPPYVYAEMADNRKVIVWNFEKENREGDLKTGDLVKAFSEDMKFIDENPAHPFTFAMCSMKNRQKLMEHLKDSVPWVAFKGRGKGLLLVKKGSKKEARCIAKGMTRTDPMKDGSAPKRK